MPRDFVHVTCPACGRTCRAADLNMDDAGNPVENPVTYGVFYKVKHLLGCARGITWTTHDPTRGIIIGIRAQLVRALEYIDSLLEGSGDE